MSIEDTLPLQILTSTINDTDMATKRPSVVGVTRASLPE
jgi:hypothetical protein